MLMNNKSKLHRIKVSGYKSIGSGKSSIDLNLSNINIIIGPNGAGKSNIVSFFKMLSNIMTGAFQMYVGKNGSAENLLYFGSKNTPVINASLEFQNEKNTDIYEIALGKAVQDSLIFLSESIIWNGKRFELASGQKETFLLSDEVKHSSEKIVRGILSNCRTFQFHDTSATAYIRGATRIDNNHFLMSDGGNIAAYLYMLKNKSQEYKKYYERIVEKIHFVMPQFSDFILEPQALNEDYIKLQWKSTDGVEYPFGPEQFSDGSIRFIALATLFLQPPELLPSVIIIDEPELGLHPLAIDILASMIKTAALHSQIIVATQSARLIDSFEPSNIIVAEYDKSNKCSSFKHLDEEELKDWLEDYSVSELWEKNVLGGQP
ncbi:AAA family ATPase [Treponema berlinense]|uniref:AAA family ATPase n=1 Tax=Treponema berlinense TaxID=225004 RepID=UPI0023F78CAB|nr:AAA family ATPase [Treponema berlinense]